MTAIKARRFNVDPTELKFASHFVGMLLINVWMNKMSNVRRNMCEFCGT